MADKTKMFKKRMNFFTNIVLPSLLAVLLFVVTLFYIVLPRFEKAMLDRKREMITELTNAATSILAKYHKDERDGIMTVEEAQQTAISRIQYLRYGDENKDYFWITDLQPVMIVHPYRSDLNGQCLKDYKDKSGKKLFVEVVGIIEQQQHGFVDYMWQWKDDSTLIVPKLSYVKLFEPWGWIVGTGIYIEDVKKETALLTKEFLKISIIIIFITALLLFYIGKQSLRIEKERRKAEDELNTSRERYKTLVEASSEGLLMIMDSGITFVNNIFQKMSAFDTNEILSKKITELIRLPESLAEKIEINPLEINENPIETVLFKKDGTFLDTLVSFSPIIFYEKPAIIVSLKDISRDKQIKDELFQTKDKFKTLMDKLNMGIFRTTIDLKGRFLEANETALKILGYKNIEELQKNYILDLFIDIDDKKSFRNNLIEKGFIKNQIIKLKRKNEQIVIVAVSLVVVHGTEQGVRFCDGLIEDISNKTNKSNHSDELFNEYVTFSQLYFQPVKNLARQVLFCNTNDSLSKLSQKMTMMNSEIAVVVSEQKDALGVITDKDIRKRALTDAGKQCNMKAFEIMSAPVLSINENDMLLEAMHLLRKHDVSHLIMKDAEGLCNGYIGIKQISVLQDFMPFNFSFFIEKAIDIDALKKIRQSFIMSVFPLVENNINPNIIFHALSILSDAITKKIIELVVEEIGQPPAQFCFISLGSDARKEQSLSTDQDNALIFEDVPKESFEDVKTYFDLFSQKVCTSLNHVGYDFCKGNVMAMNNEWCQPLKVWENYFSGWINKGNAQDLLNINIFFDIRDIYGDSHLVDDLKNHIFEMTKKNSAYLYHLAQNTMLLKPQVGFWGNILLETAGAPPETVNIKKTIMPIVNFVRIYALKNQCQSAGTFSRSKFLSDNAVITPGVFSDISHAFDYLNQIRLSHQMDLIKKDLKADNLLNTNKLNELDKSIIKKVLSNISNMLTKLSFDFKGSL